MSPIELTTGVKPRTVAGILRTDGGTVDLLDEPATEALNEAATQLAQRMEDIYDMVNRARRAMGERNRRRTSNKAVPDIDIGDFVEHEKHTKLDYTWSS